MSSPPAPSSSPPGPLNLSLPKRPTLQTPQNPMSSANRRKPSSVSLSSHPLRQTSFPPPEAPPLDSSPPLPTHANGPSHAQSMSPGASSVGRGSKLSAPSSVRKRKRDGDDVGRRDGDTGSRTGTMADKMLEEEDPEDDQDAVDVAIERGWKMDDAAEKQDREHAAMLIDAFTEDQVARYNKWRQTTMKPHVVRRIVNSTTGQSVHPLVIKIVGGYTKFFLAELIESARDVQAEWLAASPTLPTGERKRRKIDTSRAQSSAQTTSLASSLESSNRPQTQTQTQTQSQPSAPSTSQSDPLSQQTTDKDSDGAPVDAHDEVKCDPYHVDERDRGSLTPDHLREALRRYKKDREGGSAGHQGISLPGGMLGTASRTGGKRLFR
ncbi:MAG: hypothetical protein M1831_001344 [Alyxoria varia]|nr:MAG: hypothetical protein M1831_001344 [Alyxoria varia]